MRPEIPEALKDHLIEVKQLSPADVAEEAEREVPA